MGVEQLYNLSLYDRIIYGAGYAMVSPGILFPRMDEIFEPSLFQTQEHLMSTNKILDMFEDSDHRMKDYGASLALLALRSNVEKIDMTRLVQRAEEYVNALMLIGEGTIKAGIKSAMILLEIDKRTEGEKPKTYYRQIQKNLNMDNDVGAGPFKDFIEEYNELLEAKLK